MSPTRSLPLTRSALALAAGSLLVAPPASAQWLWDSFDTYDASNAGVPLGGQGDWTTPAGAADWNVYTFDDCDQGGELDFFDFLCFQTRFAVGDPYADCDGEGTLSFFDMLCFAQVWDSGCGP